jgi:tripartite-type tricarboxylate transporter receptor subunit TctC
MRAKGLIIGIIFFLAGHMYANVAPHSALASFPDDPHKAITWLVGSQPGGGFDVHSRVVAQGLRKYLGVPVIIKNMPGAGGVIAWNTLWASKPDGYTVAIVNIPGAIVSELFSKPKPQYRLRELSWIGRISSGPYIWGVGANTPYRTLKDLQQAKDVVIADQSTSATSWLVHALTTQVMGIPARITLGYPSAPASAA